jgi:hypothetical protein
VPRLTPRSRPLTAALSVLLLLLAALVVVLAGPVAGPSGRTVAQAAEAGSDPVVAAAGDIACDPTSPTFDGSDPATCQHRATAALLDPSRLAAVLPLGDVQYEYGSTSQFAGSYDPSWGAVKAITRPAIGNHDYLDGGGTAEGYFSYFGSAAGDPGRGWYSYDIGAWHVIALNSNCDRVSCEAGAEQEQWLRADLAAHPTSCTLAYFHHPRFSSYRPGWTALQPLWQALHDGGADVALAGHDHTYERFAPLDASGSPSADGLRPFTVGTGGKDVYPASTPIAGSEVRLAQFGVLELTLRPAGYDWRFRTTAGTTPDSGTSTCDGAPAPTPPQPTPTPTPTPSAAPLVVRTERDPALRYSWARVGSASAAGGSYVVEDGAGALASYSFRGSAVELLTVSGPDMGRASVLVDGVAKGSWDGWAAAPRFGVVRRVEGLDPSVPHVLTLRVSGTARAGAKGTKVVVDGFRLNGGTLDDSPVLGTAWRGQQAGAPGTRLVTSAVRGARVTMPFTGTAVSWTTAVGPGQGQAVVLIDGRAHPVDNWAPTTRFGVVRVWRDLPPGPHTITVVVQGTARPGATGRTVAVDAFASR